MLLADIKRFYYTRVMDIIKNTLVAQSYGVGYKGMGCANNLE